MQMNSIKLNLLTTEALASLAFTLTIQQQNVKVKHWMNYEII
jgi:hypothetical protein